MLVGMDAIFRQIRIALFGSQIQIDCVCLAPVSADHCVAILDSCDTDIGSKDPCCSCGPGFPCMILCVWI